MCKSGYQRASWLTLLFAILFPLITFSSFAHANAALNLQYHPRMNNAVAGIVADKIASRGYASNDPRLINTLRGIARGAGVVIGGAVAGVSWPSLIVSAGVFAVVSTGVTLGLNALIDWYFDSDGKITARGSGMGAVIDVSTLPLIPSTYALILDQHGENFNGYFREANNTVRHIRTMAFSCGATGTCDLPDPYKSHLDHTFSTAYPGPYPGSDGYWQNAFKRIVPSGSARSYQVVFNFIPPSGKTIIPAVYESAPKTPQQIIAETPDATLDKQLSPEMLAAVANSLWRAQSPESGGIPWSATNPVTATDAVRWINNNPGQVPTVADFFRPVAPPGATEIPLPAPTGVPMPPDPTPGTGTTVNLGDDPNTPAPQLESTPTAQQILAPILGLMPDLQNFAAPSNPGTCPTGSFSAFSQTFVFEDHCHLFENNRAVIETAMTLVFMLLALFIVLRA